jgi:hypothetical protein
MEKGAYWLKIGAKVLSKNAFLNKAYLSRKTYK